MTSKLILLLVGLFIFFPCSQVYADSCLYCGEGYGTPMPGYEYMFEEGKREHESTCTARAQQTSPTVQEGAAYHAGGNDYQEQAQQKMFLDGRRASMMQEQKRIEQDLTEKREQEKFAAKVNFDKKKAALTSSLKRTGSQVKGLRIKKVPLPNKKSAEKNLNKITDDITGKIPGVGYARRIYNKYKNMKKDMEDLNLNIFQYAMKGMRDGIRRLASPDIDDGGFSSEYEEGREELFGETLDKTKEMVRDEI